MRGYVGIPFVDRGRDRSGMDCWGLALAVLRNEYGKDVPDFDVCAFDTPAIHTRYEAERGRWIQVEAPEPGDVAAMSLDSGHPGMVQHVGVYVGGGRILHTLKKRESHVVRADDPYWSRKIEGWYRWSG